MLKLRKLSCHIIELSDKEAYEVGLVENLQHKTMNPVEESIAFKKYVEGYGWGGVSELSRRIGKSQEFVTKRIQLLPASKGDSGRNYSPANNSEPGIRAIDLRR
jgi:ParB family transcriptional regulator, chromosome partitioning protein